jgi:hypothetical protein
MKRADVNTLIRHISESNLEYRLKLCAGLRKERVLNKTAVFVTKTNTFTAHRK